MKHIIVTLLIVLIIFTFILELQIPNYISQKKQETGYNENSVYDFIWYDWNGFWALFGVAGCILLIYFAKSFVNKFVKRDENYYG